MDTFLVNDDPFNYLGVPDASARSLFGLDVFCVDRDLPVAFLYNGLNRLYGKCGEVILVRFRALSGDGGCCQFLKG